MKIILIISLLITIGCKSQINNNLIKNDMKYFDEKKFRSWKVVDLFKSDTDVIKSLERGDKRAEIMIDEETKQIVISEVNSPYTHIYVYNAKTDVLFQESTKFYDCFIGKTTTYDEIGKLIKEQDWDTPYKISVEELVKIVKEKLGIDLMEYSDQKSVDRYEGTGLIKKPIYVINILLRKGWGRTITIDATTGDILFDKEFGEGGFQKYKNEIYQIKEDTLSSTPYRTHNGKTYTEEK